MTNHLPDTFYTMPEHVHTTLGTKQLKETLLATDGSIFVHGHMWDIVSKHLGAGVHKVSLKRTFPD